MDPVANLKELLRRSNIYSGSLVEGLNGEKPPLILTTPPQGVGVKGEVKHEKCESLGQRHDVEVGWVWLRAHPLDL